MSKEVEYKKLIKEVSIKLDALSYIHSVCISHKNMLIDSEYAMKVISARLSLMDDQIDLIKE